MTIPNKPTPTDVDRELRGIILKKITEWESRASRMLKNSHIARQLRSDAKEIRAIVEAGPK